MKVQQCSKNGYKLKIHILKVQLQHDEFHCRHWYFTSVHVTDQLSAALIDVLLASKCLRFPRPRLALIKWSRMWNHNDSLYRFLLLYQVFVVVCFTNDYNTSTPYNYCRNKLKTSKSCIEIWYMYRNLFWKLVCYSDDRKKCFFLKFYYLDSVNYFSLISRGKFQNL